MNESSTIMAALAGVGLALSAGPLGCFVMWRRMAYFGDALAHAAILGVATALALQWPVFAGVLLICMAVALLLTGMEGQDGQTTDMLLGVIAHAGLAFGIIFLALLGEEPEHHPEQYLFGDIMSVGSGDLAAIWIGSALIVTTLIRRWRRLLTTIISPDLARSANMRPRINHLLLTLALAVLVAMAIRIVGALLIMSLLIIPAATARFLARTPESMAALAALTGSLCCVGGLGLSLLADIPPGPTIVALAGFAFVVIYGLTRFTD